MTPAVIGTGYVALDLVLPTAGPGPVDVWAGGSCCNVLVGLASLGWDARCVARIGTDRAGNLLVDDLTRSGVEVTAIERDRRRRTPIVLERNPGTVAGRTSSWPVRCPACDAPLGVPRPWPVEASVADALLEQRSADVVYVDHATPMGAALAERGAARGAVVVFEPGVVGDRASHERILAVAHVLKSARQWAWRVRELRERFASPVLEFLTDGARGLAVRRREGDWHHVPGLPVEQVVDTVGAGDWCTVGLLEHLGRRGPAGLAAATDEDILAAALAGQELSTATLAHRGARGGMTGAAPDGFGFAPERWHLERWTLPSVSDVCQRCSA